IVTISAWRAERDRENTECIQPWVTDSWALLELFGEHGPQRVANELEAPHKPSAARMLARRHRRILGPAFIGLSYHRPVYAVRAEGVWLVDAAGVRLLDAYNNVPVVGHCHPRV